MNKLPILFFALAPFVAMAVPPDSGSQGQSQAKVDKQKLQQATPVTAILDKPVLSQEGQEVGDVEDIIISQDGKVKNFVINADLQNAQNRQASQQQAADETQPAQRAGESPQRTTGSVETSAQQEGEMKVEPKSVQYDQQSGRITVSTDKLMQAEQRVYEKDAQGEMKLSEVVGMEVNLQDDESFGRIEDVMLNKDNSEVVALVVDNWDGLEKHRRALPMQDAQIDTENGEVTFSFSESDVQQMPDFNLDSYTDQGWDLADWTD